MRNTYLPLPMKVEKSVLETVDGSIRTISLSPAGDAGGEGLPFVPGQFAELSLLGLGEAPFGIASSPTDPGVLDFTVSRVGVVTSGLHDLEPGDAVGLRGPLGNGYPLHLLQGGDVLLVGGGFGFSTLRSLTRYAIHPVNRPQFGDITVVYGARNPGMLLYKADLEEWGERSDLNLHVTVDKGGPDWAGRTGMVPAAVEGLELDPEKTIALVCGPPAMMKFTIPVLTGMGLTPDRILLSLEMKMKCGTGKCGRCNIGDRYVCTDGPVFSLAELDRLPKEY